MVELDTGVLDLDGVREAIRKGDLCEQTQYIRPGHFRHARKEPVWARLCLTVGAVLIFVSAVGLASIGGYLCLSYVGG
jgi:hypothetical protein